MCSGKSYFEFLYPFEDPIAIYLKGWSIFSIAKGRLSNKLEKELPEIYYKCEFSQLNNIFVSDNNVAKKYLRNG